MFGKISSGERLKRIEKSKNYRDGEFRNIHPTHLFTGNRLRTFTEFLAGSKIARRPERPIQSVKTNLLNLDRKENVLIWFGHSSCFIQIDGKRILIDPVFSRTSSPFIFGLIPFDGTDIYNTDDIPEIDYLFITHDHWDHLDYETVTKLKPKIGKIICGLGVGSHFERWGFDVDKIIEMDWDENITLDNGVVAYCFSARHFSGRGFIRNKSLWASFLLRTPSMKIYISGDGGYDDRFSKIGEMFNGVDLAIMENGQYDKSWKYIHMNTEESFQAAKDLRAKRVVPVHIGKFCLSVHAWNSPLKKIYELGKKEKIEITIPVIGEKVDLNNNHQTFPAWWL
jgi:L-ascorbate metabolism protein UlaG (beta-lactamase superfamily)